MRVPPFLVPVLAAWMVLQSGCASPEARWGGTDAVSDPAGPAAKRAQLLAANIRSMGSSVDPQEASAVALRAVQYSAQLASFYQAVRPAWLQNHLVNTGQRERGLCFQWMIDLHAAVAPLSPATLEFHFAVAREGRPREHNALVVSARGAPIETGLVLDPWRHSGRLEWAPFLKDKYPWTRPTNIVSEVAGPR